MARAIWSGALSFGLVNIPVKVITAVRDKDIQFHLLHAKDGARIRFKRVCGTNGDKVAQADIVKGYEVAHGQYVTFTAEELGAADPKAGRTIDIQEFVDWSQIDPIYLERPYYLVPDKNAGKSYALLVTAIGATKKVGMAKVVMREKEYLVAIRAAGNVLLMHTMKFADEVIDHSTVADEAGLGKDAVDKRQLVLAQQLVASLAADFDASRFTDTHRERIMGIIEKKTAGEEIVREPETAVTPRTRDILAALEASIASARASGLRPERASPDGSVPSPRGKRSAKKRPTRRPVRRQLKAPVQRAESLKKPPAKVATRAKSGRATPKV